MSKKTQSKHYSKIITLLAIVSIMSLWNCNTEENNPTSFKNPELINAETVSINEAKEHFLKNKHTNTARKGTGNELILTPDWESISQNPVAYTKALLTKAKTKVNRKGKYTSELYFIKINGNIKNVIFTTFKHKTDANNNILDATVFFNETNGKFIDAYKIENGAFTKRLVPSKNTEIQKASFFTFFQDVEKDTGPGDEGSKFWCDDGVGGRLKTVDLGTINNGSGQMNGGNVDFGNNNAPYPSYKDYVKNAVNQHNNTPNNGGGGGMSTSGVTSGATAVLMNPPTSQEKEFSCPVGYINVNGKCVKEDKIENKLTNPCAKAIFEELESGVNYLKSKIVIPGHDKHLNFSEHILKLFKDSNKTHMTIKNANLGDGAAGHTDSRTNVITLNNSYLQKATRLSIARTMIHESVHAYINGVYYGRPDIRDKPLQTKMREYASTKGYKYERFQHEFMGEYVNAMAYSLYEWDKRYGTGKNRRDITKPDQLLGWNYYYSMAFGGLLYEDKDGVQHDTDSFKALVPRKADRDKIKQIILNEQDGKSTAKGTKCN